MIRVSEAWVRKTAKELYREVYGSANVLSSGSLSTATPGPSIGDASMSASSQAFTVGTDCSGIEVPIMALRNLGVKYRHVFSSDIDPYSKESIMKNLAPEQVVDDIRLRSNRDLEKNMDLYVAGFPCQPFSVAGYQQGLNDPRGKIVNNVLHHIDHNQPKMFVLENVKGFTTLDNGKYVKQTIHFLKRIQDKHGQPMYWVFHDVVNTTDHGIPQRRLRWYCVSISIFPKNTFLMVRNIFFPLVFHVLHRVPFWILATHQCPLVQLATH